MRVLLTGQVGLDKSAYLEKAVDLAERQNWKLRYETIGERMIRDYVGKLDDTTILNLPKMWLDQLRQTAWKQLVGGLTACSETGSREILVINSHAVLRWIMA